MNSTPKEMECFCQNGCTEHSHSPVPPWMIVEEGPPPTERLLTDDYRQPECVIGTGGDNLVGDTTVWEEGRVYMPDSGEIYVYFTICKNLDESLPTLYSTCPQLERVCNVCRKDIPLGFEGYGCSSCDSGIRNSTVGILVNLDTFNQNELKTFMKELQQKYARRGIRIIQELVR
jgi:hypothetical protein